MRRKKNTQSNQQKKQAKESSEAKVEVGQQEEQVQVSPLLSVNTEPISELDTQNSPSKELQQEATTESPLETVEKTPKVTPQDNLEAQPNQDTSEPLKDSPSQTNSIGQEHLKELVQESINEQINEQKIDPIDENGLKDAEGKPENQIQSPSPQSDKQLPKSDSQNQTIEKSSDSTKLPSEQDLIHSREKKAESEVNIDDTLQDLKEALYREENLKSKIEGLLNRIKENSEILHHAHINQETLKASLEESQAEVQTVKEENRQLKLQLNSSSEQNEKLQAQLAELSSMNFGFDKEMEEGVVKEEENFRGSFKPRSSARNSWEATTLPLPKFGDSDFQSPSEQLDTQASTNPDEKSALQTVNSEVKESNKASDSELNFSSQLKQQLEDLKELNGKQLNELKRSADEKALYVTKVAENENTAQMVSQLIIKSLDCKASSKDKKQSMIHLARLLNLSEADRKLIGLDSKSKKMTSCTG